MALSIDVAKTVAYVSSDGDTMTVDRCYKDSYAVVSNIRGDKNSMNIYLDAYADSSKDPAALIWRRAYTFKPALEGENFIAQAYEHVKKLPEYADAKDC